VNFQNYIYKFLKFNGSSSRTVNANKHTLISFIFKGASVFLQLMLIPLTIKYLKSDIYGVWLTLTSLLGWMSIFDIGIGNGLKNKLSECLAKEDIESAKKYVSTTYAVIIILMSFFITLSILAYNKINWQFVFNSRFISSNDLENTTLIVSVFFFLKFITDIVTVIAASYQMVSISSILLFFNNLGITCSVWLLTTLAKPDLIKLAFCISFIPFFISIAANIILFKSYFKNVIPSLKSVDFTMSNSIVKIGSQFFLLQIISLVIFQTDNILISQLFKPSEVTNFNVTFKYFSIVSIFFSIILAPYWTAFSDAFHKEDYSWIKNTMNQLYVYWGFSIFILIIMFIFSKKIILAWVGVENQIEVTYGLSGTICFYIAITNWNAILATFLNGLGKIKLQIIVSVFIGIINIPLSILLVKYFKWGVYAMPFSNFFCLTFGAVVGLVQYRKLIQKNASGIWDK